MEGPLCIVDAKSVVDEMKMRGLPKGERGRGRRRLSRTREGREVITEKATGNVDRLKIRRASGGGWRHVVEEQGKGMEGLLQGREGDGGGCVFHPAGVWSSLAPAALSSQSPSLNQEQEQRYACY